MREIKFRAWDKKHNKMFYHDHTDINCDGKNYEYTSSVILTPYKDSELIWMQYTGLKDKNGKEIYEGDVIENHGYKCTVIFDIGGFCLSSNNFYDRIYMHYVARDEKSWEVIGNIYENKELLNEN